MLETTSPLNYYATDSNSQTSSAIDKEEDLSKNYISKEAAHDMHMKNNTSIVHIILLLYCM